LTSIQAVIGSAPGKLILGGEHSVVFGEPALVAAVGVRLRATVTESASEGIELELPDLGFSGRESLRGLLDYASQKRSLWQEYLREPSPERFSRLGIEHPAHLVRVAVAAALVAAGVTVGPPLRVEIRSELPVGSGLGSSAALATAVLLSVTAALGKRPSPRQLEDLAFEVERCQHGSPSGLDTAAVSRGGVLWTEGGVGGRLELEETEAAGALLGGFNIVDTGAPVESTGAVVEDVRRRAAEPRSAIAEVMKRLGEATRSLRLGLESADHEATLASVRRLHRGLVALGIVPRAVSDLVDRIESEGGAAKISGAGALTGSSAGCLLIYHPDSRIASSWGFLDGFPKIAAEIGAEGARWRRVD